MFKYLIVIKWFSSMWGFRPVSTFKCIIMVMIDIIIIIIIQISIIIKISIIIATTIIIVLQIARG